jgi:hypothetical protein
MLLYLKLKVDTSLTASAVKLRLESSAWKAPSLVYHNYSACIFNFVREAAGMARQLRIMSWANRSALVALVLLLLIGCPTGADAGRKSSKAALKKVKGDSFAGGDPVDQVGDEPLKASTDEDAREDAEEDEGEDAGADEDAEDPVSSEDGDVVKGCRKPASNCEHGICGCITTGNKVGLFDYGIALGNNTSEEVLKADKDLSAKIRKSRGHKTAKYPELFVPYLVGSGASKFFDFWEVRSRNLSDNVSERSTQVHAT